MYQFLCQKVGEFLQLLFLILTQITSIIQEIIIAILQMRELRFEKLSNLPKLTPSLCSLQCMRLPKDTELVSGGVLDAQLSICELLHLESKSNACLTKGSALLQNQESEPLKQLSLVQDFLVPLLFLLGPEENF